MERHPRLWLPAVRPVVATETRVEETQQHRSVQHRAAYLARRHLEAGNRGMAAKFAAVAGIRVEEL